MPFPLFVTYTFISGSLWRNNVSTGKGSVDNSQDYYRTEMFNPFTDGSACEWVRIMVTGETLLTTLWEGTLGNDSQQKKSVRFFTHSYSSKCYQNIMWGLKCDYLNFYAIMSCQNPMGNISARKGPRHPWASTGKTASSFINLSTGSWANVSLFSSIHFSLIFIFLLLHKDIFYA